MLCELIGLNAIEASLDGFTPSVELGAATQLDGYARQRGVLHTEPGFDVPFWYVKPEGPGPHPIALFPHGHYQEHGLDYAVGVASSEAMRQTIEADDRDVAIQAVRLGYAGLAPAARGFSPACIPDVTERHDGRSCRSQLLHALLAGRTATGERVWDLARLLDWAVEQPAHDPSRVLMMGNSGGGMATLYGAACDVRVTTAVASCSYCSLVGEGGQIHHCDCNAVPGILGFGELWDVAGLLAPRRLLVVHGREDTLFPWSEIQRSVDRLREIFGAAGVPEQFRREVGPAGHRFYRDLMWPFVHEPPGPAEG